MEKIHLYINGSDVVDSYNDMITNPGLLEAIEFMYTMWPHLVDITFFDCPCEEKVKEFMRDVEDIKFCEHAQLPTKINKSHQLIDSNFEFLCKWDNASGKAIALDYVRTSKQPWDGLKMLKHMNKDEYIQVLRKAMHLYD